MLGPISFSLAAFQQPDRCTVAKRGWSWNIALNLLLLSNQPSAVTSAHALRASLSNLLAHLDKSTIKNDQQGESYYIYSVMICSTCYLVPSSACN